jgi:DNA-binding CsgD family transcriptional regulator/tetratricopeptide (TPR) repeat protein
MASSRDQDEDDRMRGNSMPANANAPVAAPTTSLPELLERDGELTLLGDCLGDMRRTGRGSIALVAGEAGVGKTTLLRQFTADRPASTPTLWGSCDPLFTPRPLGPLLDVAEALGGELAEVVAKSTTPHDAVAALSRQLRDRPGGILVLEDLHWADEATLDVLRLLARRIETVPVLVVASYRDDQLDRYHPLRLVLGEIANGSTVRRMGLCALSRAAVGHLAESYDVDVDVLFAKTSGNPFYVLEALAGGDATIPDTVRDAVLARASRLSAPARTLLEAVAVVPPLAEVWLLEALAGDVLNGLESALSSGMVVSNGDSVSFRHELARLAIEEAITPYRRVGLHRQALTALAHPPTGMPDLARLAHHAEAAGDTDAVLKYAPEAARRATELGAHREAVAQYGRALRFGDRLGPAERADLLESRAESCFVTDQYDVGIASLEEALAARRALGDRLGEGDVLRQLSNFLWCPGRVDESAEAARRSVELLEELPRGRELSMAYSHLAAVCVRASQWQAAAAWARAGLGLADTLGDEAVASRAFTVATTSEFVMGTEGDLDLAMDRARRIGTPSEIAHAFDQMVEAAMTTHRYDLAGRYIDEGLAYCNEGGLELTRLYLLSYRARLALDQGRWADAAASAETVLGIRRTSITPRIVALVVLALVRARRGDPERWPLLDEAWRLAEPTGELARIGPVAAARAEIAWLDGDRAGVDRATEAALTLAVERQSEWFVGELTRWRLRAGLDADMSAMMAKPYALEPAAASQLWADLGRPYEAVLSLADADDEPTLLAALDQLQRLGAKPAAAVVVARLRALGARGVPRGPRQSTLENVANLTSRELEVLRLLVDGRRNTDIADELVISRRTVDHHVATILRKLGARTRGEASAEARRLGLVAQTR